MKTKNLEFEHIEMVVRNKDAQLLGVVLFELWSTRTPNVYHIDEFLVEKSDGTMTTSADYPSDIQRFFDFLPIDFSNKEETRYHMSECAERLFSNIGAINYIFLNEQIRDALCGVVESYSS